ncbi:MAG: aminodeoxychorismate lyase [Candidatus Thiodiazotropha sp.]
MLINGKPGERIDCSDRGLQYGDGLFETLAVYQGRPAQWQRHITRLNYGESVLGLPATDKQLLKQEALSLCAGQDRAVLKIILTRGSGGRGYAIPTLCTPQRLLSLHPWPDYPQAWYSEGLRLGVCQTRIGRNSQLAGLKHLNRLEQVLARSECQDAQLDECLMLDEREQVICGSQSNLFMIREGILYTPDLSHSGIAGVVRELVIEIAEELSMPLQITELDVQSLLNADALFMTNSLMGFTPVAEFNKQRYDLDIIPLELRRRVERACMAS